MDDDRSAVEYVPWTQDRMFRSVFADRNNVGSLAVLLRALLEEDMPGEDWEHLTVTDSHDPPQRQGDKEVVADVRAVTSTGTTVTLEVQVRRAPLGRFLHYGHRLIARLLGSGDDYDQVGNVVTVVIASFVMFPRSTEYHQKVTYHREEAGTCKGRVTDVGAAHILQLPLLGTDDGTAKWRWLTAFAAKSWEELDMVARTDADIARVAAIVERYASQAAEDAKDAHDKWLWDQKWRENTARTEGLAEGEAQTRRETARNALRAGLPVEQVAQITGLTCDEVRQVDIG